MVYTLSFFSSKCSLFHNSNVFVSYIIHILYTGCAKIKKKIISAKRLIETSFSFIFSLIPHFFCVHFCLTFLYFCTYRMTLWSGVWRRIAGLVFPEVSKESMGYISKRFFAKSVRTNPATHRLLPEGVNPFQNKILFLCGRQIL